MCNFLCENVLISRNVTDTQVLAHFELKIYKDF